MNYLTTWVTILSHFIGKVAIVIGVSALPVLAPVASTTPPTATNTPIVISHKKVIPTLIKDRVQPEVVFKVAERVYSEPITDNSAQIRKEEIEYREGEIARLNNEVNTVKKDIEDRLIDDQRINHANFMLKSPEYMRYEADRLEYIKTLEGRIETFKTELLNF